MIAATLHEFFTRAAFRWPGEVALEIPPGPGRERRVQLTYQQLDERSQRLAGLLSEVVHGPSIVAILLGRESEYLVAAQLATLRSGAAYVCIDPSFPDAQVREMLTDSGAVALLTDVVGQARVSVLDVEVEVFNVASPSSSNPVAPTWLTADSLAYMIYTSGTTGKAKAVMISHTSIANLVDSDLKEFGLGPGDRVAQGSSAAYDSSVEETWLALASGATLVVMDDQTVRLGPDLVPWLREERISVLCPPPTLLRTTGCENPEHELPDLRLLYVGGEALTADIVKAWAPGRRLVNGYGPTECTVTCSRCDVRPGDVITIGKPVRGMRAWILDDDQNLSAEGEPGELCFSGVGLALGYLDSPELTASKFIEHPEAGRLYRTGDQASFLPDGSIAYYGRIDSQVKLRGYRVELEAIEAILSHQAGVREAACCVQVVDGREDLAAHIVPITTVSFDELRSALGAELPGYMVPTRWAIEESLPRSVGGKVNRKALPDIAPEFEGQHRAPRNELEAKVAACFQGALRTPTVPSIDADFFADLGGTSLIAAKLVSLMRGDSALASVTVRDVYESRSVAELASRVGPVTTTHEQKPEQQTRRGNPVMATLLQSLWLLLTLIVGSAIGGAAVLVFFQVFSVSTDPGRLVFEAFLFVLAGLVLYPLATTSFAVLLKRLLIGRYRAGHEPAWSGFYVRNWIVQQAVRMIPWRSFQSTEVVSVSLRALGARVGRDVHFHRGSVPLEGGWDLLDIGDRVTFAQEASLRLVDLESGQIHVGPIQVGSGATIKTRAGLAHETAIGENSCLAALASLTPGTVTGPGELWDGIPATHHGEVSVPQEASGGELNPTLFGIAVVFGRALVTSLVAVPSVTALAYLASVSRAGIDVLWTLGWTATVAIGLVPLTLLLEILILKLLGKVRPGVIRRRSWAYVRVLLKTGIVETAGRVLSGTLYWPVWLRFAGMQIGRDCEVSTIIDVVPELVTIESGCFLADGIYLGPPEVQQGTVRLAPVRLSSGTFIGNHAVIPAGHSLPEDILIGVCTVADEKLFRKGTSWFGLPPFELPRREILEVDRELTHAPSPIRFWNRIFWETLRLVVPVIPAWAAVAWVLGVERLAATMGPIPLLLVGAPAVTLAVSASLVGLGLVLKWGLLGRVKPGVHALWSCWCSRWDFFYVAWGEWTRPVLVGLEGTLLLNTCLRALGMKIGRRVLLGHGFAQVVDPDMIEIGDDATVCAMFQAHTFEDRVLKIDHVRIHAHATLADATVPLYGAEVEEGALVTPHGVIMKHERLLAGLEYEGAPTRQVRK